MFTGGFRCCVPQVQVLGLALLWGLMQQPWTLTGGGSSVKLDTPRNVCQSPMTFMLFRFQNQKYGGVRKYQILLLYSLDPFSCAV